MARRCQGRVPQVFQWGVPFGQAAYQQPNARFPARQEFRSHGLAGSGKSAKRSAAVFHLLSCAQEQVPQLPQLFRKARGHANFRRNEPKKSVAADVLPL
jgi:hypothetical protein